MSWTVVRRPFVQGFTPPYVVGQVCLEEQPDLSLDVAIEADPQSLRGGAPVEVVFHDDPRGFSVCAFGAARSHMSVDTETSTLTC
jgi:uncharacterized OB-fold protein